MSAKPVSDNALSSSATAASVNFGYFVSGLAVTNDGANAVWVKAWGEHDTVATLTTTTTGARKILPGATFVWRWNPLSEDGHGYKGFSHICDTGLTSTLRWFAK